MKKLLTLAMLVVMSLTTYAQKDVTKFLGIPVDGTKSEMIRKLKAKGFTSSSHDKDVLEGEFNGHDVNIHVVTNNNKVYRIAVFDTNPLSETDIKIRFNKLYQQFMNNSNYTSISSNELIPDEEDISYEIGVRNKRYEATFLQYSKNSTYAYFAIRYSDEQLKNPTPEIEAEIDTYTENITKKMVWFMIQEQFGKYHIIMFYDNMHNQSNGEDL